VWGLVCCAGVMHYQKVGDLDVESWNQQLDTNCRGVMNATVKPKTRTAT
jgi:NADP-dependent 3-hydroxy acid dehydrogenase YdfG